MDELRDRIAELYEGRIGTPAEQRIAAARIHWMISHVSGSTVLDIGCGQGIATLLLAREGRTAVGIDRDPTQIEWARRRVREEQDSVRRRISLEVAEATSLPFPDDRFDSVLLGRVLEDQLDPRLILGEALRVLTPGGRLVITSLYAEVRAPPFGEPLYLKGQIELLSKRIAVDDVAVLDRYVAIAGVATPGGAPVPTSNIWTRALDVAERRLAGLLEASHDSAVELDDLRDELGAMAARQQDLEATLAQTRETARQQSEESAARAAAQLMEAREAIARLTAERDVLKRESERLEQRLFLADGRIRELQGELTANTGRVAKLESELERERGTLRGALTHSSQRFAKLEAEYAARARELAEASAETRQLEQELAAERESARALRTEMAEGRIEAETARAELADLQATVERLERTMAGSSTPSEPFMAAEPRARTTTRGRGETTGGRDRAAPQPDGVQLRVLHLLARSLPHTPSAIAIHRHALLRAQQHTGLESGLMTELDFPWDVGIADPPSCEFIDGIPYYRLHDPHPGQRPDQLASATRIGEDLLTVVEPQILHAASLEIASLAVALARRHSLPVIIELANEPGGADGLDLELLAAADRVIALSDAQRARVLDSGLEESRVHLIPAFVDVARFARAKPPRRRAGSSVLGTVVYRPDSPAVEVVREAVAESSQSVEGLIVRVSDSATGAKKPVVVDRLRQVDVGAGEVGSWLAQMDVVVASTPHEALDAMAAARAVVGTGPAADVVPTLDELDPLLSDRQLRGERASAARKEIEARHTTSALEAYSRLYAEARRR
jgi:ubiquinone/menaquinone biosynthesis C-methylase UbiE